MLSLDAATQAVWNAGWRISRTYRQRWQEIPGLPEHPEVTYVDWPGWTVFMTPQTLSYKKARKVARLAGFTSRRTYLSGYARHPGLPRHPEKIYGEWTTWTVFLATTSMMDYQEAMRTARNIGITTGTEYFRVYKQYPGLPSNPHKTYALQWQGWEAFLGKRPAKSKSSKVDTFLSYSEAQKVTREAGITTFREYNAAYRKYPNLPSTPPTAYASEWRGWSEFLGKRKAKFLGYHEAMKVVRKAGITSYRRYATVYRQYPGLPSTPNKDFPEWQGWAAFLGKPAHVSYEMARRLVQELGVTDSGAYRARRKDCPGLPSAPEKTYMEWQGWPAFLTVSGNSLSQERDQNGQRVDPHTDMPES